MIPILLCLATALALAVPQPTTGARAIVTRAIDALGGEPALRAIKTLQIESIGHDYFIDQSERPEGPFVTIYVQTSEKRDIAAGRSRLESQQRFLQVPEWAGAGAAVIVDADTAASHRGERFAPAGRDAFEDGRERLELAPERVLFTALAAADLATAPDIKVHGVTQRVVTFGWRGRRARLLIDSGDDVPTALEVTSEDTFGMMAYFPALGLLYTSDEIQRMRNGTFFMPEFLLEVRHAVRREHLEVDRVFGFHVGPTPWSEVEAAIASAAAR